MGREDSGVKQVPHYFDVFLVYHQGLTLFAYHHNVIRVTERSVVTKVMLWELYHTAMVERLVTSLYTVWVDPIGNESESNI